jgi:hypothetical protein
MYSIRMSKPKFVNHKTMRLPRALLYVATAFLMVVAVQGCKRRPDFEVFETRISATVSDPKNPSAPANEYSALMKAYMNHVDGTVNVTLVEPIPPFTLQCPDCVDALMARASVVISQAYPEYQGLTFAKSK